MGVGYPAVGHAGAVPGATGVYYDTSCTAPAGDITTLDQLTTTGAGHWTTAHPECDAAVKQIGARAWVTSSSEEKLRRARELGADETLNYETMDIGEEIRARRRRKLMDGKADSTGGPRPAARRDRAR